MPVAPISATGAGDQAAIAAPGAGKRIRLYSFGLIAKGAVDVSIKSGSTVVAGPYPFTAAGVGISRQFVDPILCGVNEAVTLNLSAGSVQVGGDIEYAIQG